MDLQHLFFWVVAGLTGLCAIGVVVTQNIVRAAAYLLFTLGGVAAIFFLLGADFVGATQLLVYVGGTLVLVVFGVMLTAQGPFVSMRTGAVEWAAALVVGVLLYGVIAISLWPRTAEPDQLQRDLTTLINQLSDKNTDVVRQTASERLVMLANGSAGPTAQEATHRALRQAARSHAEPTVRMNAMLVERELAKSPNPAGSTSTLELGKALLGVDEATAQARLSGFPLSSREAPKRQRVSYLLPFEIASVHLLVVLIGAAYLARAKRRRGANS